MEEKEKKPDRRVLKTKKAIRNALAQLLAEKELEEITVKEVADTADINRKTFYNYYAGVHQVIDEIENEIISTFDQAIREVDARRDIKITMPTAPLSAQIGIKESRQTVAFLVELNLRRKHTTTHGRGSRRLLPEPKTV